MAITDMTGREYLAAHAPHEPQEWFEPVMPERPKRLDWRDITDAELRKEVLTCIDASIDPTSAEASEWFDKEREADKLVDAWKAERNKQRFVQWPWAWADAVLAAREATA